MACLCACYCYWIESLINSNNDISIFSDLMIDKRTVYQWSVWHILKDKCHDLLHFLISRGRTDSKFTFSLNPMIRLKTKGKVSSEKRGKKKEQVTLLNLIYVFVTGTNTKYSYKKFQIVLKWFMFLGVLVLVPQNTQTYVTSAQPFKRFLKNVRFVILPLQR